MLIFITRNCNAFALAELGTGDQIYFISQHPYDRNAPLRWNELFISPDLEASGPKCLAFDRIEIGDGARPLGWRSLRCSRSLSFPWFSSRHALLPRLAWARKSWFQFAHPTVSNSYRCALAPRFRTRKTGLVHTARSVSPSTRWERSCRRTSSCSKFPSWSRRRRTSNITMADCRRPNSAPIEPEHHLSP